MSIFICNDCERTIDSDLHPCYETQDELGLICESCQEARLDCIAEAEAYGASEPNTDWGFLAMIAGLGFAITIVANILIETGRL